MRALTSPAHKVKTLLPQEHNQGVGGMGVFGDRGQKGRRGIALNQSASAGRNPPLNGLDWNAIWREFG